MALDPRARLGPYEIVSLVGAGGMGEIYKATDTRLNRTVAIKVLTSTLAVDPGVCERFDREARIVSRVDHPHICPLYDIGTHEGTTYLVMPYLEGETLAARLQRGPLALDEALECAIEMLDALNAAHHAGITHRDLKPANVMLTKSGVKLLDFGVAKLRSQAAVAGIPDAATSTQPTPLTRAGTFVGTIHYMSPEQLEGHEGDQRSDVFAFGAVLYEMLTGRKAFDATSQAGVIAAIMEKDVQLLDGRTVPAAVERIVRKCLAKDPEERWQTAKDLGDELRWVRDSTAGATRAAVSGERHADDVAGGDRKPARRRRFVFRLTIGISVSIAIAAGLMARRVLAPIDAPAIRDSPGVPQANAQPPRPSGASVATVPLPPVATTAPIRSTLRGEPPGAFETRFLQAYLVEVIVPCATLIDGRYPLGEGPDLRLADFGRVFGYRGLFDKFFNEHLAQLVDTSKRPWTLRRSSPAVPNDMLPTFEQAARIREMFFFSGSQTPELQFVVRLSGVDPATTRFVLAIDGQRVEAGPGADNRQPMLWPGGQTGETYLSTEDRIASPAKVAFSGPWAAFRMADALALQAPQGTAGLNAAIVRPTHLNRAQVTIETPGINPFASQEWRQFRCQSSTPAR